MVLPVRHATFVETVTLSSPLCLRGEQHVPGNDVHVADQRHTLRYAVYARRLLLRVPRNKTFSAINKVFQ